MSASEQVNDFLVNIFNRINKYEERTLAAGLDLDVSITEIHILSKIGDFGAARMSDIAKAVGVTLATLTVACDKLESKGLIERNRGEKDKRVVNLSLSPKGIVAYQYHLEFHENMVRTILDGLTENETEILSSILKKLKTFFLPEEI